MYVRTICMRYRNTLHSLFSGSPTRAAILAFILVGHLPASAQTSPRALPTFTVPSVALIRGQNGSVWRTQLVIYNRGSAPADVTLEYRTGMAVPSQHSKALTVAPGISTFDNVLFDVFRLSEGIGAILVYADGHEIYVTSRTSNIAAGLTAAEEIPGYSPSELIHAGQKAFVLAPSDPTAYRFNYGVAIASTDRAAMNIRILDQNGRLRREQTYIVAPPPPEFSFRYHPYYHRQWGLADASASDIIEVSVSEGAVVFYGSAVSQTTGHPLYSPAIRIK